MTLAAAGALPTTAGLLHHGALPPLDLFADVRVLLARTPSHPVFALAVVAVVTARALVLAAVLGPIDRAGVVGAARLYGLALPPALVSGGLSFAGVTAVYSLFLWLGVAVAVLTFLVLGPRPWRAGRRHGRGVGLGAAYVVVLVVLSLPSALGGPAARVALVPVSVALTATTARLLARPGGARRGRPGGRRWHRWWPAAAVVATVAAFAVPVPLERSGRQASRAGTLFVVPGIGGSSGTSTMFRLDPETLGFGCERTVYFSYAGPGPGAPRRDAACPIRRGAPYVASDTGRPLGELALAFRAQYAELEPPVVVVAHSQGAWVAAAALGAPGAGEIVAPSAVVLLGGFPGHVAHYRLDGSGAGVVGTDLLEALTWVLRGGRWTSFDPRAPLARAVLGTEAAVADLVGGGFGTGVRVVAVTSAFDLPIMNDDRRHGVAVHLCPRAVHHGSLPGSTRALGDARRVLDGDDAPPCPWWRRWPTRAFSAFAVPLP